MPNGNERAYVGDKHADYFFTCCERDPSKKNAAHFVSPTAKKVRHTKNGGRQAAPRLRLVVKKTEFTGKMCASATFHHLFYALLRTSHRIANVKWDLRVPLVAQHVVRNVIEKLLRRRYRVVSIVQRSGVGSWEAWSRLSLSGQSRLANRALSSEVVTD